MKFSKYNFVFENILPNSKRSVIYNSRTGALAVLESKNHLQLLDFVDNRTLIEDLDFKESLYHCGYLVDDDFDELQQIKLDLLSQRHDKSIMNLTITDIYPLPKHCFCQADHCNSWCIDSLGNVYKCLSDIGIENRKVATLSDFLIQNTPLFHSYMLYDATEDPVCRTCKYLPICMGGCPYFRIHSNRSCDYRKYNLEEYLAGCAKALFAKVT